MVVIKMLGLRMRRARYGAMTVNVKRGQYYRVWRYVYQYRKYWLTNES